jgi:hypothetical protein
LGTNFDHVGASFLLVAALSRHGYANGGGSDLGMVTLWKINLLVLKPPWSFTMLVKGALVSIVRVVWWVVVVAIYDGFAGFAHTQVAGLVKDLAWDNRGALWIEYLTTGTTVVLATEGGESISAVKAVSGILIPHPKLPV